MKTGSRRVTRLAALIAGSASIALVLGACSADGGGTEQPVGEGVPFGASADEWAAAFEDMDPITVTWETPGSATSASGVALGEAAEKYTELSGGKVTIEIVYTLAVSGSLVEVDSALQDGRIDIGLMAPYLESQDYPISGTIANDSNILFPTAEVGGWLAGWSAAVESLWATPEFIAENEDAGLYPVGTYSAGNRSILACRDKVTSLDDLEGKQVRVAPITNFRQVEAMGATPVSIPYTELFESVQRGLVDCIIAGMPTITGLPGLAEEIPYVVGPVETNWSSTATYYAGGLNWESFPVAVQQLLFDMSAELEVSGHQLNLVAEPLKLLESAEGAGGGLFSFKDDANEKLADFNETIVEEWRDSPLLDGDAYVDRFTADIDEWVGLLKDLDVDFSELSDTEGWSEADIDWDAYADLYNERVVIPNRPGAA